MRYHLVLEYNFDSLESVENKYLQKVYDLYETVIEGGDYSGRGGVDGIELLGDAQFDCAEVFWPFVKAHSEHLAQARRSTGEEAECRTSSVVRMQVRTVDGSLRASEHDRLLKYCPDPIENPFPDLNIIQQTEVRRLDAIASEIYKVTVDGQEYCLKTVYSTPSEETFLKELTILRNMPRHANVIPLSGVVETEDGRIEGLLTPYINGLPLRAVKSASEEQKNLWKREITEAILWLHARNLVWGDAKPRNIMIDAVTNHPVLVNFGGGTTFGRVDVNLQNTQEGDLQELKRIVEYIDAIKVT